MERWHSCNLFEWVRQDKTPLHVGRWKVDRGHFVKVQFSENSKHTNRAISRMLADLRCKSDLVLYFDMRNSKREMEENVWLYKIFSFPDLVIATGAIPSIAKSLKIRLSVVFDCYNFLLIHKYDVTNDIASVKSREVEIELFRKWMEFLDNLKKCNVTVLFCKIESPKKSTVYFNTQFEKVYFDYAPPSQSRFVDLCLSHTILNARHYLYEQDSNQIRYVVGNEFGNWLEVDSSEINFNTEST